NQATLALHLITLRTHPQHAGGHPATSHRTIPRSPTPKRNVLSGLRNRLKMRGYVRAPDDWPAPALMAIEPTKASVTGLKALMALSLSLKLPTSRSPPKAPKADGASTTPHGEASGPPTMAFFRPPLSEKTATAPSPSAAVVCAAWPAGA